MIIDYPESRPLDQYPRNIVLAAEQSYWNSDSQGPSRIVQHQKNSHVAKPFDTTYECRSEMCLELEKMGIQIKHHHLRNRPYAWSDVQNGRCFSDDEEYSHLSKTAHYFMGGLLKHIASLCAITNPSTNSFKRLVPGFEAPVTVGYATSNRSAVIHIPAYAKTPKLRRFKIRNPDANGWGPYDMNLYTLPEEEKAKLSSLLTRLEDALDTLEADHDYLTAGGVFLEHLIKNFAALKRKECLEMSKIPHPAKFDKYFNL